MHSAELHSGQQGRPLKQAGIYAGARLGGLQHRGYTCGLRREELRCMRRGFGSGEASFAASAGVSSAESAAAAALQRGEAEVSGSSPASLPSARAASMAW